MVDVKPLISLFLFFSFLVTNKVHYIYIIELFYHLLDSIYLCRGFKVFQSESLESCYQFDGKKVHCVITSVISANTVNGINLISVSKSH